MSIFIMMAYQGCIGRKEIRAGENKFHQIMFEIWLVFREVSRVYHISFYETQ
jgi:hypothetical protein